MSSSAKPTPTGEQSSPGIGPESRSTRTFAISENQRAEVLLTDHAHQLSGGGGKPGQGYPAILTVTGEQTHALTSEGHNASEDGTGRGTPLIYSQAGSRAKTSPSPDEEGGSPGSDPACSSSSPGSQGSLFAPEGGCFLRTYPDFFPPTAAGISPSFERRWPTSGSWTGPGECWTHDASECPSGGGACSSLRDVLHRGTVPERFSLSPRAAAGILRRATKRGRTLPPALLAALTELASTHPDGARRTT